MTSPARRERYALCDTALELGPAAPTLCSPWDVAALLAHLHVREARPDLAVGIAVPPLAGRLERGQAQIAAWPFEQLVATVRTGPPVWNPARLGPVDDLANLAEMFIHHEDIRRANDLGERTAYDPDLVSGLATQLKRMGPLMFRSSPVGVVLQWPRHDAVTVRKPRGAGSVTLVAPVAELTLYASGRERVATVDVEGPPEAVAAFESSR